MNEDNSNGYSAQKTVDFSLKIVYEKGDFTNASLKFKPDIVPEIIEENNEKILRDTTEILLSFLSSTLTSHINVPVKDPQDTIYTELIDLLKVNYVNDPESFLNLLDSECLFKPPGQSITTFQLNIKNQQKTFEIFVGDFTNKEFREYQQRAELFALFFIDGANCLDSDEKWLCFLLFEIDSKTKRYHFVGYASTYRFYAFPDKIRPRISQFVIVPSYQRQRVGKRFLLEIYNYYGTDEKVVEITVEDPCEEFLKMRDILDAERFKLKIQLENQTKLHYTKELIANIHTTLKIPTSRIRRLYEIVKLYHIRKFSGDNQEKVMAEFKDELKKRLTLERTKQQQMITKSERCHKVFNRTVQETSKSPIDVNKDLEQLLSYYNEIVTKMSTAEES